MTCHISVTILMARRYSDRLVETNWISSSLPWMILSHGASCTPRPFFPLELTLLRTSAFDKNLQMDRPLTDQELDIIRRLYQNENPDANYDPYEPTVEWFTGKGKEEIMPLSAAPEPKRRWIPSKWEKQKVFWSLCLVSALRIKF